ncbi:hypothetical protein [Streptomyces gardneri]|uniref:hypothetical protein n=1 Tax=Streptomyces gardneri TaxID=66892 RepID=UPI0035E01078
MALSSHFSPSSTYSQTTGEFFAQPPWARSSCLERNAHRPANRRVPEEVLLWQHSLAQKATMDVLLTEGFSSVFTPTFDLPDVRLNQYR